MSQEIKKDKFIRHDGKIVGTQDKPSQELLRLIDASHKTDEDKIIEILREKTPTSFYEIRNMCSKLNDKELELLIRVVCRIKRKTED